jgi:hypothetical protein
MHLENAWDYYFNQPNPEISLDDVYKSRNVFICYNGWHNKQKALCDFKDVFKNTKDAQTWHSYMMKYANIREEIIMNALRVKSELFGSDNIMGVSVRIEFLAFKEMKNSIVNSHAEQPSVNELKIYIKRYMQLWKTDRFFLSIDDRESLNILKDEFGVKLLSFERPLFHRYHNGKPLPKEDILREINSTYPTDTRMKVAIDYLTDAILLSQCDYLLASHTSLPRFAVILNNGKYQHQHIIEMGSIKI